MAEIDLEPEKLEKIRRVLRAVSSVESAGVFGSRVLDSSTPHSDIDIVLFGAVSWDDLGRVRAELDELPIPQKCDVQVYETIESPALRKHIDDYGKTFYSRMNETQE